MLINLKAIHTPTSLAEAADLLKQPGTFPLYGGGALQRSPRPDVTAGVDLRALDLDYVRDSDANLRLGTLLTLEQVRQACADRAADHPRLGALAEVLADEHPATLRNTLTLGDLLMEREPDSPLLTLLLALGGVLKRLDLDLHFTIAAWLAAPDDVARYLIAHVRVPRGPARAAVAYEKVARTPKDRPIVAAVACAEIRDDGQPHTTLALCGAAPTPTPQPVAARIFDDSDDMERTLDALDLKPPDDHWGSADYRAAMARVLARRAITAAHEKLQAL